MTDDAPRCVGCGVPLTGHRSADGSDCRPEPGAVSICAGCGHLAVFAEGGEVREPTLVERAELLADPDVRAARRALDSMRPYQGPFVIRHP